MSMDHVGGIDELRSFQLPQAGPRTSMPTGHPLRGAYHCHYAFAEKRYPGVPQLLELKEVRTASSGCHDVLVLPITVMHHCPCSGFPHGGFAYARCPTIPEAELDKLRGAEVLVLNALRRGGAHQPPEPERGACPGP